MKFNELHEMIPYATGGKAKSLTMEPYPEITLALPGRHADQTTPPGGDFVVMVTAPNLRWKNHQFKHDDIFADVAERGEDAPSLMKEYLRVIQGGDTEETVHFQYPSLCLSPITFIRAIQCLAVAEHRRYAHYESKFGGRYLPFRFAAGISEGMWTAGEASEKQKYGRPAVERLEKQRGVPALTQELMK